MGKEGPPVITTPDPERVGATIRRRFKELIARGKGHDEEKPVWFNGHYNPAGHHYPWRKVNG